MENRRRAIITTLTTIVASAATSMMESRLDVVRPFGGSRAAALIWIMPFWHTLGMTFVAAASAACKSDVQRPVLGHRRRARVSSRNTSLRTTWSLTSPRADRTSGPQKSWVRWPEKTFSTGSANSGLILAPIADAGVSAAVRSTAHRPAVGGFQKQNRNPVVGSMLLCWKDPKPNPPCTCTAQRTIACRVSCHAARRISCGAS
jgi:hypothetical protein